MNRFLQLLLIYINLHCRIVENVTLTYLLLHAGVLDWIAMSDK